MERYILFRSRGIHTVDVWQSHTTHRARGSDFSDIWPYIVGDDTRDISWKHSARTDTIQKKVRTEEDAFPIYIIQKIDTSNEFYTEDTKKSTHEYATELQDILFISARKYHCKVKASKLQEIKQKRNSMIFYITSSLDIWDIEEIRGLARHNDLIVIHVFHPYELDPQNWLLFDWFWLSIKSYKRDFDERRKRIEKVIQTIDAWYILTTTDMDIPSSINRFFKRRYSQ
jgi:uncharacterized protein (DUF58 family)